MKPAVIYTLDKCQRCMRCLKACPTEAITIENNRVSINPDKCINCGKCIQACLTQGLETRGSTLVDINNYDYTICMVPSALICMFETKDDVEDLFNAIKSLGFDDVVDMSDVEAQVLYETRLLARMTRVNAILPRSVRWLTS